MKFRALPFMAAWAFVLLALEVRAEDINIQGLIDRAVASGQKTVTIPAGEYRLSPPARKGPHLAFRQINGLTVEAKDVKIICEKAMTALDIQDCTDLTIRGLTIDYDPLLNTQGVVEEVDLKAGTMTVKIDEGYPCSSVFGTQIQIFNPATRLLKKDSSQINNETTEELPGRQLRITTPNIGALKAIAIGDLAAMDRKPEGPSHAINIKGGRHVVMKDVTVCASPSFGVLEGRGDGGNEYRRFRITPGPKPVGAATERLRSIADDGIHSIGMKKGPLIEDCLIERHGDDGIAIHGSYQLALGITGKTLKLSPARDLNWGIGDKVTFYNTEAVVIGEAHVANIGTDRKATPEELELIKANSWALVAPIFQSIIEVELDSEVPVVPGVRVVSRDRCGNGFVIRHNTVRDHRARGILVKASDGVIENNTVDNSSIAGIVISPELHWMEADFSSNIKITGNTIRNTGIDPANASRSQAGAISISAEGLNKKIAPTGGHKNIVIAGNTVENCRGAGLVVTSAENVQITGNRFEGIETGSSGSGHGIPAGAIVWIDNTENVTLANNNVPKDAVVFGQGVTQIQAAIYDRSTREKNR